MEILEGWGNLARVEILHMGAFWTFFEKYLSLFFISNGYGSLLSWIDQLIFKMI